MLLPLLGTYTAEFSVGPGLQVSEGRASPAFLWCWQELFPLEVPGLVLSWMVYPHWCWAWPGSTWSAFADVAAEWLSSNGRDSRVWRGSPGIVRRNLESAVVHSLLHSRLPQASALVRVHERLWHGRWDPSALDSHLHPGAFAKCSPLAS